MEYVPDNYDQWRLWDVAHEGEDDGRDSEAED